MMDRGGSFSNFALNAIELAAGLATRRPNLNSIGQALQQLTGVQWNFEERQEAATDSSSSNGHVGGSSLPEPPVDRGASRRDNGLSNASGHDTSQQTSAVVDPPAQPTSASSGDRSAVVGDPATETTRASSFDEEGRLNT